MIKFSSLLLTLFIMLISSAVPAADLASATSAGLSLSSQTTSNAFAPSSSPIMLPSTMALPLIQNSTSALQRAVPASSPVSTSLLPLMFGSQLFNGNFRSEQFPGFNPNYQITIGDRINLRIWGAVTFEGILPVDPQGNIFVPNLGPVQVLGTRNGDLNSHIQARAQKIFRSNVGLYATLDATQPVKVFVTGYVTNPGLYAGLSSDSLLYYIDKAGGVGQNGGSYIDIKVMRNDHIRKQVNLYEFLLNGHLELIQLSDGDTIIVGPRKRTVTVTGEVYSPFIFEFESERFAVSDALKLAKQKPNATHVSITRRTGREKTSEYFEIDKINGVQLADGDELLVQSDRYSGTVLVRVEGAHAGEHALVLPYGATLQNVLDRLRPTPRSNLDAIQLFRKSVARRQKEMLETSLRKLEAQALTARSSTLEEAGLRTKEADLILKFVERARDIEPKGQIVLAADKNHLASTLLEDGDTVVVPEKNSLVIVHGEVLFPNAIIFTLGKEPEYYIQQSGGYTQNADSSRVLLLKNNGAVLNVNTSSDQIAAGDELMVLPKIATKHLEIAKGFAQILYQIAVATRALMAW